MSKPKKRKKKKPFNLVGVVLICFVSFCSVNIIGLQVQISEKKYQLEQMEAEILNQTKLNKDVEGQITKGAQDKDENIGRVAFEQYGYGYPDEHVYIDSSAS